MSDYTIGVEEEYQLVDPVSCDLRSSARAVLAADWSGEIRKELQESTIEIGTRVATTSAEVRDELRRLRAHASAAATTQELDVAACGLHPFADWHEHQLTAGDRYARMAETYGRIARDEHNFGMHVHVALEADRLPVLNQVRRFIPHLIALSCSSPYHEGEDSGFASYRLVLWRRWPGATIPPRLASEAELRDYIDAQLRAGVLGDERNLYWMIRPHPAYPTLEFRMCDVCPSLEDAVAIAGFVRVLVAASAEGAFQPDGSSSWSEAVRDHALADDCWRVTRYGLDARVLTSAFAPRATTVRDDIRRLADSLAPVAAMLGESAALGGITAICDAGNATDRMRRMRADGATLHDLMRWVVRETLVGTGIDRRRAQRAEEEWQPV